MRFPIRLVKSGRRAAPFWRPAWRAKSAWRVVLSFDMGGTTAKICLIDDLRPQPSSSLEVAPHLPLPQGQWPAVAHPGDRNGRDRRRRRLDRFRRSLSRVNVGPESAGAEPGPASYGRGGTEPTVTDADVVLGRIDPGLLRRRPISCSTTGRGAAIESSVGTPLGLKRIEQPLASARSSTRTWPTPRACTPSSVARSSQRPHDDRLRWRRADACRAARRETRHPPRHGAERCRRRLGGRLPEGAGRLRGRAQPLRPARRRFDPGDGQRAVRRDARRGRGRSSGAGAPRRSSSERARPTCAIAARVTRSPSTCRRGLTDGARELLELFEEGYAATFGRDDPGRRRRDHELDRSGSRAEQAEMPQKATAATPTNRPGARSSRAGIRSGRSATCKDVPVYRRAELVPGGRCRDRRSSPRTRRRPSSRRISTRTYRAHRLTSLLEQGDT